MVRPHYFAEIILSLLLVHGGKLLVTGESGHRRIQKVLSEGGKL